MFFEEEPSTDILPLLSVDECSGQFRVEPDAKQWLESQPPRPLSVAVVVGKYRTGKSALLNRLIETKASGFKVGNSINACTKGLWVYREIFSYGERHVLFMDTEGICSLDASNEHDIKVMTAALMLSSMLLYNSVGPIDEAAMQSLGIMLRISRDMRAANADLGASFPRFVWVMRDLALRLETPEGTKLTPNEYLEGALSDTDVAERSEIRACLRECFAVRDAFVLPRPCDDVALTSLDANPSLATPAFRAQAGKLRTWVRENIPPLSIADGGMTPSMFVVLCEHVAEALNANQVPALSDAWKLMNAIQARDRRDALADEAMLAMTQLRRRGLVSEAELERVLDAIVSSAVETLSRDCPRAEDVLASLRERLLGACDELRYENMDRARDVAGVATREVADMLCEDPSAGIGVFVRHDGGETFGPQGAVRAAWLDQVAGCVPGWLKTVAQPPTRALKLEEECRRLGADLDAATLRLEAERNRNAEDATRHAEALSDAGRHHAHELEVKGRQVEEARARIVSLEESMLTLSAAVPEPPPPSSDPDDELVASHAAAVEEVELTKKALEASREEAERMRAEAAGLNDRVQADNIRLEQHEEELRRLAARHEEQLSTAYARLQETATAARAREEALDLQARKAREELGEVRSALERTTAAYESSQQLLHEKLAAATSRCADVEARLNETMTRELEAVKQREVRQREHEDERLKLRLESNGREVSLSKTISSLETELRLLRKRSAEFDNQSASVKSMRAENDVASRELSRTQAERTAAESRKIELQSELVRLQTQNASLVRDNSALQRECELLRASAL